VVRYTAIAAAVGAVSAVAAAAVVAFVVAVAGTAAPCHHASPYRLGPAQCQQYSGSQIAPPGQAED